MAKTPTRPRDPNQLAKLIVDIATGDVSESAAEVAPRGRAGGKARAEILPSTRRVEIAQKAAKTRWYENTKKADEV
jgi:hypothetical protein